MKRASDPHARLRTAVETWAQGTVPGPLPTKWERFADVVLLPQAAFTGPEWQVDDALWKAVSGALGAQRLGRVGEVSGDLRESGVVLLRGEDDWVVRREHGIDFGYRFTHCMWSAGNVTERGRIANADHTDERVLDLYAGIGYYTLPFLSEGARGPNGERGDGRGAEHVVACEWNPEAADALRWSLNRNGFTNRCTILEGDNRNHDFKPEFDRVNLGLLPSASDGYPGALSALKERGGVLHIHGLAPGGEEAEWAAELAQDLAQIGPFDCAIEHVENVKWYAPHQRHIVVDVQCRPVSH